MGLTAKTGKTVLYIWILAAKILSVIDVKGSDYRAFIPYDSSVTMEENMGEVKSLPGFSVCKFRRELITGLMFIPP